jgi:hypothetical protein
MVPFWVKQTSRQALGMFCKWALEGVAPFFASSLGEYGFNQNCRIGTVTLTLVLR